MERITKQEIEQYIRQNTSQSSSELIGYNNRAVTIHKGTVLVDLDCNRTYVYSSNGKLVFV